MLKRSLWALAVGGMLASGACLAHAKLTGSTPASGAHVAAPQTLTLNFSENAQLTSLNLVSGAKITAIPLDKGTKAGRIVDLTLPALAPGDYTVQWSALAADDGHLTKGSFVFTVTG
jgi:copper resistance protein C